MRWLASAGAATSRTSVEVCVRPSLDERLPPGDARHVRRHRRARPLQPHRRHGRPDGLVPPALEVAARSDVALTRVSCLLGAAWGLADTRPGSVGARWCARALDDIADVPALTRLTLPGSAVAAAVAARPARRRRRRCSSSSTATPTRRSFVDLIPLFYGAALLDRLGHPAADPALGTVAVSPPRRTCR